VGRHLNDTGLRSRAIEASVNAIAFTTLEGKIGYVNRAFLKLWGLNDCKDIIEKNIEIFLSQKDDLKAILEAVPGEGHWIGEVGGIRHDESRFCAQLAASLLFDHEQNPMCIMMSFMDISETKKIQAALARSEETYAKAEAIAHIGSWDWDIINGGLSWTDEIYRIFGQAPKSFGATYEAFLETIHEDDRQKVVDAVNAAVADKNVEYHIEHRIVRIRTGEERVVQERGKVYRNEAGDPIRMIGTVYDITEQKRKDEELRLYRERLEELVEERTLELHKAQAELVRSERLATLGQLTATVSHELRNPLGAIRPSLYYIRKKLSDDQQLVQAYQRIERNIARCDHIIDELLDFTRITTLEREETLFKPWLENLIGEILFPDGIKAKLTFSGPESIVVDTGRLRRAIVNILENAWQAIAENKNSNEKLISIQTKMEAERVAIEIKDSGVGMTDEVLERIFEPLYSTKGFGVGLGMPTVKQIMEQHSGGIEIESIAGSGTTVKLWLPITCVSTGGLSNEACVSRG